MIKEIRKYYLIVLTAFIVLTTLLFTSCNNQKAAVKAHEPPVYLFKVKVNDKWGFIDSTGKIKIKPQFNHVGYFTGNLAPVKIGGVKTIDTMNKVDGRMLGDYWVIYSKMKGEKCGYIDTTGKFKIQPIYDYGFEFSNGLAVVRNGDSCGYINTSGVFVIPPKYTDALPFYDEYASVSDSIMGTRYFIDKTGKKIFAAPGNIAMSFIDGLAYISIHNNNNDSDRVLFKSGFINKRGHYVVKPIYDILNFYNDGRVLFGFKSGDTIKCGFLDQRGKIIIPAKYSFATDFSDSLAWVEKDSQLCVIDVNGKILLTTKYKNAQQFSEGLSAVKINGKWGYCDKQGEIIIEPQFDKVEPYDKGLAWVEKGNVSGYINKSGRFIWSQANK